MAMNNNHIELIIDDENWANLQNISREFCDNVLNLVCDYLSKNNKWDVLLSDYVTKPIDINLLLSNSEHVRLLNAQFRGVDKPTNVLSFANIDDDDFVCEISQSEKIELGDIVMSFEVLKSEAELKNIDTEHHFAHLLVHGILHLMGFDHEEDEEAEVMENIEIQILKTLGINNPYIE